MRWDGPAFFATLYILDFIDVTKAAVPLCQTVTVARIYQSYARQQLCATVTAQRAHSWSKDPSQRT